MSNKKIENMTKEEVNILVLKQKTEMENTGLEKYRSVLLKYAFVETCTAATYFEDLFQKELMSGSEAIRKANLSKEEENKMLSEIFWGPKHESVEEANYQHAKRLAGWAKHNLNQLPHDIKKKIIDDSISYQDAWSQQFNKSSKVYDKLKEMKDGN